MNAVRQKLWGWRWPMLAGMVMIIGLALRIWKAWSIRYAVNGDFGIVALIAKHMAEGSDYPALFYGQPYMGVPEPALAALLAILFRVDVSSFIVNLGTALVGALLLPLLYVYGRDAGSRRAGVIAMLYCLVGSDTNFHYAVAARAGYMSMMTGGLLALWMACRIATREHRGESASWRLYAGMGLAAGVAWWATQLTIVFMASAAAVVLSGVRWNRLWRGIAPALAGFLLGGLPWWGWNLTHQWGSFDFSSSLGKVPFREGLQSFGQLFLQVVEMSPGEAWFEVLRVALLAGMIVFFVGRLIREKGRGEHDEQFFFRLAIPFLALFMVLAYSTSHYVRAHASRYLLPIIPGVAIVVGLASDWLLRRFRFPWGWLAFVLVLPPHILSLPRMSDVARQDYPRWELASRLEHEAAPQCDGVFVGDYYQFHWINFVSRERLCVAALPAERYAPYARRAELAERPAYLADYGNLQAFLRGTGGTSRQMTVNGVLVNYDVTPPSNNWNYVEPADVTGIRDAEGKDCREMLLDLGMDSSRAFMLPPLTAERIAVTFRGPVPLCGVRLFSRSGQYPRTVSIEGRSAADGPWRSVLPSTESTKYFWSGSRLMLDGVQFFQEFRFAAPTGGVTEIRLTFHGSPNDEDVVRLSELLFLRQTPAAPLAQPSVAGCVEAVRGTGAREFYAPRWLAERLSVATSNTLTTLVPSLFARSLHDVPATDSSCPYPLRFRNDTALLMDARDLPRSRAALGRAGLSWRDVPLGTLGMLVVEADPASRDGAGMSRAYWTEQGCFAANADKERAQRLLMAVRGQTNRIDALREAVRLYPPHQPVRQALVNALIAAGRHDEAAVQEAELKAMTLPTVPAGIRFANGVEFLGLNVDPRAVRPGQTIQITYFWKCPASVDPEKLAAFVHVTSGKQRFQDDHVLLRNVLPEDLRYQPFEEVFTETRVIVVPASTSPGHYRMSMGVLDRETGKRLRVRTELTGKKGAVELPVEIEVVEASR